MRSLKIFINRTIWIMIGVGFYIPFIFSIEQVWMRYGGQGIKEGIIGWFFSICLILSMVVLNRYIQKREKDFRVFDED